MYKKPKWRRVLNAHHTRYLWVAALLTVSQNSLGVDGGTYPLAVQRVG